MLRSVELSDIDMMYGVENDRQHWRDSGTVQPFSQYLLGRFVESQNQDIYTSRQLRLVVEADEGECVGVVDLFEFDPQSCRAGVGIFILEEYRRRGYGGEALRALEGYCCEELRLHQLWCGIAEGNAPSLRLFEGVGYTRSGVRRDWLWRGDRYEDEIILQYLL